MRNIFKQYYKATPAKWRKIGDCFLMTAIFALGMDAIRLHPTICLIISIIGIIGKFITNFFAEPEVKTDDNCNSEDISKRNPPICDNIYNVPVLVGNVFKEQKPKTGQSTVCIDHRADANKGDGAVKPASIAPKTE